MRAACLVVLCACSQAPDPQARVAPLDLVMDNRVVLTPGNTVTIPVKIQRAEPDPEHPVQLALSGGGGEGVFVSWTPDGGTTANTKEDYLMLTISVTPAAAEQEVAYAVDGKLGPHDDREALVVSVQMADPAAATTEEYAPGVTGVMKTVTLNGQEVTYEVINGIAIVGGDIELGEEQTMLARSQLRSATCNPNFHTDFACSAWTNGVIGYSYANNWGDEAENARMRGIIDSAMREWTRLTGMRFVPRVSGERIQFQDGDGCSAGIGRVVLTGLDPQYVRLNNSGCDDIGRAMHEIGHAIGLYHEQMRNDRGNWVSINWGRIQEDHAGNFFQIGDYLINRGVYDYDSIMHYEPWAFAKNKTACKDEGDLNECTILPTNPASAAIGQRDHLSEGDAHGVYTLYPPVFTIAGATDGQTGDRFHLFLDYERGRPGVHADYDYVEWRSSRVDEPLGRGNSVDIRADQVPVGINEITARFVVRGQTFRTESITLNFQNERPVLEVFAVNGQAEQEMNQPFSAVVTVNDAEDGTCSGCQVTWDPAPLSGQGLRVASYSFAAAGTRTIRVTVEDLAGGRTTAALTLQIVNSAPVVTIERPTDGSVFTDNTTIRFRGRGSDTNTGALGCAAMTWTSDQPTDVVTSTAPGFDGTCEARIRLTGVGPHTITLTGTDGVNTGSDTVSVTVQSAACTATGCPPIAYFEMPDPDRPDGSYLIEREMDIVVWVGDVDVHSPIHYRLYARRAGTTSPIINITWFDQTEIVSDPEQLAIGVDEWTPSDGVGGGWPNCVVETRDYEVVLEATDSSGMTTTFSRIFKLACDFI